VTVPTLPVYHTDGTQAGELEVSARVFDADPKEALLHQVVVAELADARQGTAHTKTRGEVSGSGRKLWRQKGTGRARVGDRRPPHRVGGGVAAGPRMRSYRQRLSRRARAEALCSALSARARAGELTIVDALHLPEPKTRALEKILATLGAQGRALLVLAEPSDVIWRSGRNLPGLLIRPAAQLNAYDVLVARRVIIAKDAMPRLEARLS